MFLKDVSYAHQGYIHLIKYYTVFIKYKQQYSKIL